MMKTFFKIVTIPTLLLLIATMNAQAAIYVKIKDIDGEASAQEATATETGHGRATGKRQHEPASAARRLDKSSPKMRDNPPKDPQPAGLLLPAVQNAH